MSRKILDFKAQFLLPEDFSGNFLDALRLYMIYCEENWHNSNVKIPSNLPDEYCFPFMVENGKMAHTTFSIEPFSYGDLLEPIELDMARDEEEIECLTESNQ